ncbi:hypothetical protein Poli38472_004570 [Pythium oligandrum]|uniref:ABC1 atypical kinase-like domain-containing protein n=1 Tax=Pythium oligandrum TaxID=41045 RepID=A0A8K1CAQ0_PYTOL|nr:hypothetical protein Poli38472_004570 [Pythium oligandrum]|eukprot:TMW59501.1 hypothetical protein Poli38472_004570 [Pythium oligandrum]
MAQWRRVTRTLGAASAVGALGYTVDESNSHILSRSLRVFSTGIQVAVDFRQNLKPIERDAPEYKSALQAFNLRTASRLLDVCFQNGGIYTKFGQQLSTFNHALPREFTDTMAKLQDQAKSVSFEEAMATVEQELQRPWREVFPEINETPLAAASLAQVHEATDYKGRRVAVKVQYPHLARQMTADLVVMRWAFELTEWFFPNVQITWMFPEFQAALESELNFVNEKQNSRRIAELMRHNPNVHVPIVYDDISSKRLLVMEFIDAPKISNVEKLKEESIDPSEVARVLCEVFGEMVFCHGFVHCDPHPGNIFVRKNPNANATSKSQLVLLDHGLYRHLDEDFRKTYCDLWRAMILRDSDLLQDCGRRLNAGPFTTYLPLLFTYRPLGSNTPLASKMSLDEREKLTEELRKLQVTDVNGFIQHLPRDMLFVFRTNNMIRALNKDLGGSTRDRFASMAHFAVEGHALYHGATAQQHMSSWLVYYWDRVNMILHLRVFDWALRAIQLVRGEQVTDHRSG